MKWLGGVPLALSAALVFGAGGAGAAEIHGSGYVEWGKATFTAAPGEVNRLVVSALPRDTENDAARLVFTDVAPRVLTGDPASSSATPWYCTATGPTATCSLHGEPTIWANLGDRADTVEASTVDVRGIYDLGPGNDVFRGGKASDSVSPGLGSDIVTGLGAHVNYSGRTQPVRVTLAGGADDGELGEGDDIRGVRGIGGGAGDDHLTGSALPERLSGYEGVDRLEGMGGDDMMTILFGVADGGAGNDWIETITAEGKVLGADGDDFIRVSGRISGPQDYAAGTISCGAGADTVEVWDLPPTGARLPAGAVTADCESVTYHYSLGW